MEIQVTSILLQMLNFGIVAGALAVLLFKPIQKILEERAREIKEGHEASLKAQEAAAAAEELKQKAKREAQQDAKKIVEEAKSDAAKREAELVKEAKAKANDIIAKGEAKGSEAVQSLLAEAQASFTTAVIKTAGEVIGAELDAKKHTALIKKGLQEIAAA